MTAVVAVKPDIDEQRRVERTRSELVAAQRERAAAVSGEYEGLVDIAWKYHRAASSAILAVSNAHGITDDIRLETIQEALNEIESAARFLRLATSALISNEPPF